MKKATPVSVLQAKAVGGDCPQPGQLITCGMIRMSDGSVEVMYTGIIDPGMLITGNMGDLIQGMPMNFRMDNNGLCIFPIKFTQVWPEKEGTNE